jgi:hypothetical protein
VDGRSSNVVVNPGQSFTFRVNREDASCLVSQRELQEFADITGLSRVAPHRWSWLFALQLSLHEEMSGVDPSTVIDEIKRLERGESGPGTKPATRFSRKPLRGLWHKHFFSAHFLGMKLANEMAGGALHRLVRKVLDPAKSPVVTKEMIGQLTFELTEGTLAAREEAGKLTGEWIVFAKHEGANYYLCISLHTSGDDAIYQQIQQVCARQFPFLAAPKAASK